MTGARQDLMPDQELDPLDHLGLVVVALKRWSRLRAQGHWEDTEEWSVAVEGLIIGCRTFRAETGFAPSTWLVWTMRSKLKTLETSRRRRLRKDVIAHRICAERIGAGVFDENPDEQKEWIDYLVDGLPWQERSVIRRTLHGQMKYRIAADMKLTEYEVGLIRKKAHTLLREMIEKEY